MLECAAVDRATIMISDAMTKSMQSDYSSANGDIAQQEQFFLGSLSERSPTVDWKRLEVVRAAELVKPLVQEDVESSKKEAAEILERAKDCSHKFDQMGGKTALP